MQKPRRTRRDLFSGPLTPEVPAQVTGGG